MGDISDIMGVKKAVSKGLQPPSLQAMNAPAPLKSDKPKVKKPRELMGLTDTWENKNNGATPDVAALVTAPVKFKAKTGKAVRWNFIQIESSARLQLTGKSTTDLKVHHWVRILNVPDYRFAKFCKRVRMFTYTDEEYEQYLRSDDWSKEDTDLLFALCMRYGKRVESRCAWSHSLL